MDSNYNYALCGKYELSILKGFNAIKLRGAYKGTKLYKAYCTGFKTFVEYVKLNGILIAEYKPIDNTNTSLYNQIYYIINGIVCSIQVLNNEVESVGLSIDIPYHIFSMANELFILK